MRNGELIPHRLADTVNAKLQKDKTPAQMREKMLRTRISSVSSGISAPDEVFEHLFLYVHPQQYTIQQQSIGGGNIPLVESEALVNSRYRQLRSDHCCC